MTDVISQAIHLRKAGNYHQALALLEEGTTASAALHCEKGLNHYFLGQHSSAADYFRQALALEPSNLAALVNLGACFNDLGNHQEAIFSYEKALLLDPANASAWGNLAKALHDSGEFERSIYCYHRALDAHRAPQHLRGLALAYRKSGRFDRSRELLLEALAINPNDERAHFGLAMNCFYLEEYEEGLKEFEWRAKLTKQQNFRRESPAIFSKPEYFGGSLAGKTLLLYTEQGFGDSIQFSRFIPLVREQAARIVMWCRPGLGKLFAANFAVDHVSEDMNQLPPFDMHLSLMSLPRYFDPTLQALQNFAPYINPVEGHETFVRKVAGKLNVGLVWGAEQLGYEYANKKVPLEMLTPLFDISGIAWHSLQVGPDSEDLKEFPLAHRIQHHGDKFHDFADTAAAVQELDLIVSVDTAVAHLAGAMGKPVWVLLPKHADWRWHINGQLSRWYRPAHLFRQTSPEDWSTLTAHVVSELETLATDSPRTIKSPPPAINHGESLSVVLYPGGERYIDSLANAFPADKCSWNIIGSTSHTLPSFADVLSSGKTDILHLHWPESLVRRGIKEVEHSELSVLKEVLQTTRSRRCLIVLTAHNLWPHNRIQPDFERELYRTVVENSDGIIHHSHDGMARFCETHHCKNKLNAVVPHGYFPGIEIRPDKASRRKQLGVPSDACIFLTIGLVRPYKRIEFLLEGLSERRNPSDQLWIVGPYNIAYKEKLELLAKERQINARFFGSLNQNDLISLSGAADLLLFAHGLSELTTASPHLSQSLLIPQVSLDAPYVKETLGELAATYQKDNLASFINAIEKGFQMDNQDFSNRILVNRKGFSWETVAERTLDFYIKIQGAARKDRQRP